ncbi:MAG: hypothetical protein GX639_21485 [Fibrobacter sp.]|nr:hypothetical protein [Fibrobacter sp.]
MRKKVLSGISLFSAGIILMICTCKELPTNPYKNGENLKVSMFLSDGLLAANAGDSLSVGLVVNIPSLVKKLMVVQGDDQKEITLSLNRPQSLESDTVYFKTMFTQIGKKEIVVNAILGEDIKKTFPFPILVVNSAGSLWKQDTLTISVQEDTVISYSLPALLKNPSATNIVFTSSDTGVSGTTWKYTIPWGTAPKDTISLFASNGESGLSELKVLLVASPKDTVAPLIALVNPSAIEATVSDSIVVCKFTVTDKQAGVGTILVKNGIIILTDTLRSGSTFQYTVSGLKKGDITTIDIVAYDKSMRQNYSKVQIKLTYDPLMQDNVKPELRHRLPATGSASITTPQTSIEIVAVDRNSGIDSVWAFKGTTRLPVMQTDSVYSVTLDNLVAGKTDTVIFKAQDKSAIKNADSLSVYITYDPSMVDNVPPTVVIKNPLNADQRVLTDTITVQIDCSDDNNISSVTAMRGGVALGGITNTGSLYSVKVTELRAGKSDTLNFKVVDNSSNKVVKDYPVILRYNRMPTTAILSLPAVGATGVAKIPTFTWTDGIDPDGDVVTYTVRYGTAETALTRAVSNLTAKTTSLTTALDASTKYYWQVVTHTAENGDSAVSDIASFTTEADKPVITVEPVTQSVVFGNKGTFSITATGSNLKYQWYKGTQAISGATLPTYTTPVVLVSDDGSTYYCVVTNGDVETKSSTVSLIVLFGVTYDVNGGRGTAPIDNNTYAKGETVVIKSGVGLTKTNYSFSGWTRSGVTNSRVYSANDTLVIGAGNIILDVKWTLNIHTVSFDKNDALASGTMSNQTIAEGSAATLIPNTFVKPGWDFAGWATTASGSVEYKDQVGFDMGSSDVTLYAKWTPKNFTVSFDKNNSDVTTSMSPQTIACGSSVNLNANTFVDGCRTFAGWSTSKTGKVEYADKASFTMGAQSVTLYAIWKATPLNISPKLGDTVEVCINDPIVLPSCARSYEWHFVSFGGDQIVTDLISEFSGAGTNTLRINTQAGMYIYCNITDLEGNIIKTGTWMAGGQWCDYE